MYELFIESIPDYKGKICVPLSGGLDSRVLAGLISKKRKIDLTYCQYELKHPMIIGTQLETVDYSRKIADICGIERFEPICVNYEKDEDVDAVKGLPMESNLLKSRMYTGLRILNDRIDLSDYTIISGHGLDSITGVGVNPLTLLTYKRKDIETEIKRDQYFDYIFDATYGAFGEWDCPLWNPQIIEFCMRLPMKYRFHQRLYRQMIKKYFPELAKVPREGMNVRMNIGEIRYFYERLKYWLKK